MEKMMIDFLDLFFQWLSSRIEIEFQIFTNCFKVYYKIIHFVSTFAEEPFVLTFRFSDSEIKTYTEDDGSNFQYSFDQKFDMKYISNLQIWGDLEYINEITIRFNTKA